MTRLTRVLAILTIAAITSGCVHQRQDNSGCTGSVTVSFYSQSRCEGSPSYPGSVTGLLVAVFDSGGTLAAYSRHDSANITEAYTESFDLAEGLYTTVAWSGLDPQFFELQPLTTGRTVKTDLLLSILREQSNATPLDGATVLQGEGPAFYIPAATDSEITTAVNMLEVTNRLDILVEGLPDGGNGYTVTIEADNGSMTVDGQIAPDEVLTYLPSAPANPEPDVLGASFTLLKLETGHTYQIVITRESDGFQLYRGSLLGALILKNPQVDLLCDHDFTIRFTAEDQCDCGTYAITEIWVNNWLVHSYSTEL